MKRLNLLHSICLAGSAIVPFAMATAAHAAPAGYDKIDNVVVIYAENRSFDNLYGSFPGADGLSNATADRARQLDRDGQPLSELPPAWGGLTAKGVSPAVTEAQSAHLANASFAIDDPKGFAEAPSVITRDLWHRFYQEQMQIDGGKNDKFVAWADSGSLVMGHYDGSILPMWQVAKKYVMADNFFQGAFGGSFLNHFALVCACAPYYPDADKSPAKPTIAKVDADGTSLTVAENAPKSALEGAPKFVSDFYKPQGNLNEHGGYADVSSGDQHLADIVSHLEKSPQWAHMLVIVTYDENGGFWDHVAPPKADRWGPGNRIPAFIISPFAKGGMVDHTQYDTTSIIRFITARYDLPVLPGILARDRALRNNDRPPMGDLTAALDLTH
ncbi:hypothetical protein E0H62_15975 [Rhizobium leguminosarum bv. viciae]|nr:hypothetical protein E0H62_15975 [Rhizobium leguminosarum bv. viciae]